MNKRRVIRPRDTELWKDFDKHLLERYGTKHTVMTAYIERGLYYVLGAEGVPGYETVSSDDKPSDPVDIHTHKKLKPKEVKFLNCFYKDFFMDSVVTNTRLSEYIRATAMVKDWRAVQNWRHLLENLGWIESPGPRSKKWNISLTPKKYDELLGGVRV